MAHTRPLITIIKIARARSNAITTLRKFKNVCENIYTCTWPRDIILLYNGRIYDKYSPSIIQRLIRALYRNLKTSYRT